MLAEAARRLNLRRRRAAFRRAARLPPLILLTDAARLPDPVSAAARLPRGSAVILRHYEWPRAARLALARRLRGATRPRRVALLIAGDADLALRVGADGLHLPEWRVRRGRRDWRRKPGWLITTAAHGAAALRRAATAGADAALLSPVFATASHPGAPALGALRFAALCRAARLPVYALGGVTLRGARRLTGSGAAGVAAIGGASHESAIGGALHETAIGGAVDRAGPRG